MDSTFLSLYSFDHYYHLLDKCSDFAKRIKWIYHGDGSKVQSTCISDIMNAEFGEEDMQVLTDYCSVDNLTVPGEVSKIKSTQRMRCKYIFKQIQTAKATNLHTLRNVEKSLQENNALISGKYKKESFITYEDCKLRDNLAIPGQDILVSVRVYEPFQHYSHNLKDYKHIPRIVLSRVIEILGSQTLAQLRDKISCISDLSIPTEVSNNPDVKLGPMAKDVYKSGFLFIENIFYNDTRDPNNLNYSQVIKQWAQMRDLGSFQTASLEHTRIDSLTVRFGFPWVYQHQGSCEHLIVFSAARLINENDEQAVAAYPRVQRIKPSGTKYCMMCSDLSVSWITTDNDRVPHDLAYYCDTCFRSFNYIDGIKIGNFKAYAYPRNPNVMVDETPSSSE
ncbi:snRNA-activating protein complex subunit 3 isoform X2 [Prorops nasuta]|uniref:snRNA-activating protein complex subunit 3 isoform X2 n=1 Tax=Prorops nasuta TaxID=863751 RepID=UPI0034CDC420